MLNSDKRKWLEAPEDFIHRFNQLCRLMPTGAPKLFLPDYAEIGMALGDISVGEFYNATASILETDDSFPSIARIIKICRMYKGITDGASPQGTKA